MKKINDLKEVWETECTYIHAIQIWGEIYLHRILEEIRIEPGYMRPLNEMFLEQQDVEDKVQQLRDFNILASYSWEAKNKDWIELECLFKEEEDEEKVDFEYLDNSQIH